MGWFKNAFGGADATKPAAQGMKLDADSVVPRLKVGAFLEALARQSIPAEQMPVTKPFVGDLLITYAFDTPKQFIMASEVLLQRAGLTRESVGAVAQRNLARILRNQDVAPKEAGLSLYTVALPDLAACLMLVDSLWEGAMARRIPGEIVVAVPHRDRLLACSRQHVDKLELVMKGEAVARSQKPDNHALSMKLFRRAGGRWSVLGAA